MKHLLEENMTVPKGLVVPLDTVVWPAALKNVTAISSDFAAELMSSTGMGNVDRLLSFSKASADSFLVVACCHQEVLW